MVVAGSGVGGLLFCERVRGLEMRGCCCIALIAFGSEGWSVSTYGWHGRIGIGYILLVSLFCLCSSGTMGRLWLLGRLLTNLGLRFLAFLVQAYCLEYTVGVDTGKLIWAGSCF